MDVEIKLIGCDDSTIFVMKGVSMEDLEFLDKLSKLSEETSTYGCMPVLIYKVLINSSEEQKGRI